MRSWSFAERRPATSRTSAPISTSARSRGRAEATCTRALRPDQRAARASLVLAGHSLGAALATLAMSQWRANRLATFACPRVGDAGFAATIAPSASMRYVGCCDIVCSVPPAGNWYADAGSMRYIDRTGIVCGEPYPVEVAADRSSARREYLAKYAARPGNVLVRELADHAPINHVRALMPRCG